jgi:hypothetical protein
MDTILGLAGLTLYIIAIVALASAVTWAVVKLSPSKSAKQLEAKTGE